MKTKSCTKEFRKFAKHLRAVAKTEKRNDAKFQALGLEQAANIAEEWAILLRSQES